LIEGGASKIQGTTFRVSNMGDETAASMGRLFEAMDAAMGKL
jgi:aspartate aminotransferase-like enzyme